MADIIGASGLSAGSFYRYYRSKDELIGAIIDRYLTTLIANFQNVNHAADPAQTVIAAIQTLTKQVTDTNQPFARLLPQIWSEAMRNRAIRERGMKVYGVVLEFFAGIVKRAQAEGKLQGLDPDGTSRVMMGLVQGFILQQMLLGAEAKAEAYADTVRKLLSGEEKQRSVTQGKRKE